MLLVTKDKQSSPYKIMGSVQNETPQGEKKTETEKRKKLVCKDL